MGNVNAFYKTLKTSLFQNFLQAVMSLSEIE